MEHLDIYQLSLLGNTVCLATNNASNVSAVSLHIFVCGILDSIIPANSTALEFWMIHLNATVENIHGRSLAGTTVIDIFG